MLISPSLSEVHLDFWGVGVLVRCTSSTARHLQYYFEDYVVRGKPDRPDIDLRISGDVLRSPDCDFEVRYQGWPKWQRLPPSGQSVFPPLAQLAARGWGAVHGSALQTADGRGGMIVTGESTSGKSTLALELIRRGWRFLSDDTTLVTPANRIVPFTRPIGVRENTLLSMSWMSEYVLNVPRLQTATGTTFMVHPTALARVGSECDWLWTARLTRSDVFRFSRTTGSTFAISCDLPKHVAAAADVVEAEVLI